MKLKKKKCFGKKKCYAHQTSNLNEHEIIKKNGLHISTLTIEYDICL